MFLALLRRRMSLLRSSIATPTPPNRHIATKIKENAIISWTILNNHKVIVSNFLNLLLHFYIEIKLQKANLQAAEILLSRINNNSNKNIHPLNIMNISHYLTIIKLFLVIGLFVYFFHRYNQGREILKVMN